MTTLHVNDTPPRPILGPLGEIRGARRHDFGDLGVGKGVLTAEHLGHEHDFRELLVGFHPPPGLLQILPVGHGPVIGHQHRVMIADAAHQGLGKLLRAWGSVWGERDLPELENHFGGDGLIQRHPRAGEAR